MRRLRALLTVTSVRLSIAYTIVFGVVAALVVLYMMYSTENLLRQQIVESVEAEIADLARVYEIAGMGGLMRRLERSATAPGANLYVVSDPVGQIVAGNVRDLANGVIERLGWTGAPFEYTRFGENGNVTHTAIARVILLPNRMRLLVGRDLGEPQRFNAVVARALGFSITAMVVLGLAIWVIVGRQALRRLDRLAESSSRIMAGDLSERLPVSGANDEFDRLSSRLNAMLDRISSLDEGVRHVADNIAHDLKTPLSRLRNRAEQAVKSADDATRSREELLGMVGDIDQIIATFNALLMIARVESGASAARLEPVDLGAIAGDVAELYEPVAEEAGFVFETAITPGITVNGNRELLSQALSNLVDNAIKYGRPDNGDPVIRLSLEGAGSGVRLCVGDRGVGIAPENIERVLQRFVRLEESRSQPGNGLGLALVSAIARLHGGVLELADNEPGLIACLKLPRR